MEPNQETAIILRILGGERDAYALLIEEYKNPIFNLAYRMTGSYEDAADMAQEAFVQAYVNLKKFRTGQRFFTWLYTIALNIIRNYLKKESLSRSLFFHGRSPESDSGRYNAGKGTACRAPTEIRPLSQETPVLSCTPEETLLRDEERQKLVRCIKRLPLAQREAVVLRFYQGLSFEEIAAVSGLSQSAVKMRVYRGLERLKQLMNGI